MSLEKNNLFWQFPLGWSALLTALFVSVNRLIGRYALRKKWAFRWSDAALAAAFAGARYLYLYKREQRG